MLAMSAVKIYHNEDRKHRKTKGNKKPNVVSNIIYMNMNI